MVEVFALLWSVVGYAAAVVICVRLGFGCLVWARPFWVEPSPLCFELYLHIWPVFRPFILIVMSDLGILGPLVYGFDPFFWSFPLRC